MTAISCIGCGNMGGALMRSAAKAAFQKSIFVSDSDKEKSRTLTEEIGANLCADNSEAVLKGDFVFLAVKPQVMEKILLELAPAIAQKNSSGNPPVLVSMAAGWTIAGIRSVLNISPLPPIVRIMPNTPALISKGLIAMAPSSEVPQDKAAELEKILSASGIVDRLEEKYLNAVTGLSGSGPAFVYLFIEALADGGVLSGLPRDKALRYAAQTVFGSAAMVLETGKHPGELKDMVCSPGGTTIEGIKALENGALRGTVIDAVEAAWLRAEQLSKL